MTSGATVNVPVEHVELALSLIEDMSRFVGQMALKDYAALQFAPIQLRLALTAPLLQVEGLPVASLPSQQSILMAEVAISHVRAMLDGWEKGQDIVSPMFAARAFLSSLPTFPEGEA